MIFKPTPGWALIAPLTDSFFSIPDSHGQTRMGEVIAIGEPLIHASGKLMPSPVKVGDTITFQYVENHDIKLESKDYYIVQFNLISGVYGK